MKTINNLLFVSVLYLLTSSCSTSEDPEAEGSGIGINSNKKTTGSMTANVGGNPWVSKTVSFKGGLTGALYDVSGFVNDQDRISLQFINTNNLVLNKYYDLDTKSSVANLNANVSYYLRGNNYMTKKGTFVITKFKTGEYIEGEMNLAVSNFIDKDILISDCKFKIEIK